MAVFLKTWEADYFLAVMVFGFGVIAAFLIYPEERYSTGRRT
jgi:hypothetical protein